MGFRAGTVSGSSRGPGRFVLARLDHGEQPHAASQVSAAHTQRPRPHRGSGALPGKSDWSRCTPGCDFLTDRKSSILEVWAAPGSRETFQKNGGGLRPPPFWKVSRPPGAAQTPKIDENLEPDRLQVPSFLLSGSRGRSEDVDIRDTGGRCHRGNHSRRWEASPPHLLKGVPGATRTAQTRNIADCLPAR